ncbi:MAG: mechanosensitive ion channel [Gemmatimonadota bacterium]|jgi:small-conductance mechanosensitive channel
MKSDQLTGFGRRWAALSAFCRAGLAAMLSLALIVGCGPGDDVAHASGEGAPAPSRGAEGDSVRGIPPEPPELRTADTPSRDSITLAAGAPPQDSVPSASPEAMAPPTPPQDSTSSGSIATRLARVEAENDSLRVALGTLVDLLASGTRDPNLQPPEATGQVSPADSARGGSEILSVDAQQVQHWGFRIVVATLFLILFGGFIRLVIWVLDKLAERNAKRRLFFKRLVPIARISLWFLAILFASMVILRIEAQGLIAAGAAVGVAVGFAAQDILKNIFGGLIVLFDQPFQVGDKISVAGTYGEVVSIGLRSTRIVTPDDNLVTVPNAQVVDGQVANANAGELNCQVVTDLYLPGWVDEARAKRIAFEAAVTSKYVYLNKPVVVLVKDEFKETFLTHLKVKAYVLDPRHEFLFMSDVTERARVGFREAGLLGPMHGVRAYIDLDRFPEGAPEGEGGEEGEDE